MNELRQPSVFLKNTLLWVRIAALVVLGGGPFACREWRSLTILTLISVFIGFSKSIRGVFAVLFGILMAVLFSLVESSQLLVSHPRLSNTVIVFSAYGVSLYALSVIVPHLDAEEILRGSRTTYRPFRGILVRVCHVVVQFMQGHAGVLSEVRKNLRVAGVPATLLRPMTCIKYIGYFMTGVWLYILFHAEAYSIAIESRLAPWLDDFRRQRISLTLQSYVVLFATILGGYIVFLDFIFRMFGGSP